MTRFVGLSHGGVITIPSVETCPECDSGNQWVHSETPEGKEPLAISGDPEGAEYYCQLCGNVWPVILS